MSLLADDLRRRSDDQLVQLLQDRPDLAVPAPSSVVALAARAATRPSVERAMALLDRYELDVLEAVVVLTDADPAPRPTTSAAVGAAVGADAGPALRRLAELALVVGGADGLLPAPPVADAVGPYPAGLGPSLRAGGGAREAPLTGADDLARLLAAAPDAARRVLHALTWGTPLGTIDPDHPGPGTTWLLDHGLLVRLSPTQVALPREVGLAARGWRTNRDADLAPPIAHVEVRRPETVGAESARAADEMVRQVARLLELWDAEPPALLRTGGVGNRELRRTATALEVEPTRAAFVVELAAMGGLLGPWAGAEEPTWLPTPDADHWLEAGIAARWSALVRPWLRSARTPWLVGTRNERGELRAALAPGLERTWVPALRKACLTALATWPERAAPAAEQVHELLLWRAPRATPPATTTAALLDEIASLGLTGAGALSGGARALLTDLPGSDGDAVAAALEEDLPPLVDEIVVQGDLTGLVPGRPTPDLAALLTAAADVESRGAALTVRFTARSVRRALDHGYTGDRLLSALRGHSVTPLPQPLEYLVGDAARTHATLRVGAAASYLRSEDAGALAALLADARLAPLGLRPLAPTVLVSAETPARVLEALRAHDVGAVVEGPDGSVISMSRVRRRAQGAMGRPVRSRGTPAGPTGSGDAARHGSGSGSGNGSGALAALVAQMRAGDEWAAATAGPRRMASAPAHVLEVLRDAAASGREVRLDVAGPTGSLQHRRVRPLSVDAGRLRALDTVRESELTVAVHRIAGVMALGPEPERR